jgi:dTDP-4-amino-4,6-dideoxygalactose transaminase
MTTETTRLAVEGGTPVRTEPLPHWPHFDDEQVQAAAAVLASGNVNYWTGSQGRAFEQEMAGWCLQEHAIATANGTVALEMIVRALGLGPGDDVIVTPRTFIASVACVIASGARPVFADVDPDSQAITAESITAVMTPQTRAVVPVHLAGWPADMPAIMEVADEHGIAVIEDGAQAHGATVDGRPIGSFGVASAFSMCQDKIITTGGEGGAVVTSDADLWKRMWAYKDQGKDYDETHREDHPPGFRWLHHSLGTNARLTEMQSVLGRIQLARLDQTVETRRRNAAILNEACAEFAALRVTRPEPRIGHAYYKHYTFVRPEALRPGWDRDRIMEAITAEGIPCFSGSCPEVYLERAFDERYRPVARLPVARELGETALMFLVHPTLDVSDMEDTAAAIAKVMRHAAA